MVQFSICRRAQFAVRPFLAARRTGLVFMQFRKAEIEGSDTVSAESPRGNGPIHNLSLPLLAGQF
jgi:hypothetical protein